ncbi:hypothetical protein RKD23_000294 [Streptomyces sp. SAI-170]|uniref:DUF5995 family protein n=1 Tax=Streptomyces sp. SAI-170 TaxID=3377729 RepID=UPI003C7E68D3
MTQSQTRTVGSVDDVIERMQAIKAQLDPRDGVACFNRMYLRVTELVGQNLVAGFFEDQAFIERMDVIFAGLYFDAVDAAAERPAAAGNLAAPLLGAAQAVTGHSQNHQAWQPLFDARDNRTIWPIQFAFAGMNAHINHDLALAVIDTCIERGTTPDTAPVHADYLRVNELLAKVEAEIRASFEAELIKVATKDAETLKHIVGAFSIARARDSAWATAQSLWHQRSLRPAYDATLTTVATTTATIGRALLVPVLPPVEQPDGHN